MAFCSFVDVVMGFLVGNLGARVEGGDLGLVRWFTAYLTALSALCNIVGSMKSRDCMLKFLVRTSITPICTCWVQLFTFRLADTAASNKRYQINHCQS